MTERLVLRTSGPDDTRALAAAVAEALQPGDVVSLTGELGAGKTCFVQGAARQLGVTGRVTSPSFLLRRDYDGNVPVLHLDVYRLDDLGEVLDLGFEEAGHDGRITFVEWGDAMSPLLPPDHLEVELLTDAVDELDHRRVTLIAHGDEWRRRLAAAEARLARWADASVARG